MATKCLYMVGVKVKHAGGSEVYDCGRNETKYSSLFRSCALSMLQFWTVR